MEDWVFIQGFSRYLVSDQGRVQNHDTDRMMRPYRIGERPALALMDDGGLQRTCYLGRLVANAFVQPESDCHNTPIHLDGNFENCRATNLKFVPRQFAVRYARQFKYLDGNNALVRDVATGEELGILDLVIREGLLYYETVQAIEECTVVFPSMKRYEWVE